MSELGLPPAGTTPLPIEELQRLVGGYVLENLALRHELALVTHERDLLLTAERGQPPAAAGA